MQQSRCEKPYEKLGVYATVGDYIDNFASIRGYESKLCYGDTNAIAEPLMTVVIPTYRRDRLLKEAIQSVLSQQEVSFSWDIVVMDNTPYDETGSTPALKIAREFNDGRLLYYHNEHNLGPFGNWNRGVELARGKWVVFLHDDDMLCSNALKTIGKLVKHYSAGKKPLGYIQASRPRFTGSFNEGELKRKSKRYDLFLSNTSALIYGHTQVGAPTCGSTFLREAYMAVGGGNSQYGSSGDTVIGYKICEEYAVIQPGEVLGGYRWEDNDTLKETTMLQCCAMDFLFSNYRYSRTWWSRLFGRLFWKVQYEKSVLGWISLASENGKNLDVTSFDFICPYSKANPILKLLYRLVRKIYWFCERRHRRPAVKA